MNHLTSTTESKKQSKKEIMYSNILQHGINLNAIFNTGIDPIALCKKLHRLEYKAHSLCLIECNTGEDKDSELEIILKKVKSILFPKKNEINQDLYKAVFINGDARGYALKIKSEYVSTNNIKIEQDWGGYGLICPDYSIK